MALEVLNREGHAGLRLTQAPDSQRHFAQIVASEFVAAAQDHPILFTKHPETGAFYAGVVMGVEPGRNLRFAEGRMQAYRPADLERQGFFVADAQIVVDPAHPAFADPAGEPLFAADGEPAPALRRVQRALAVLQAGLPETDAAIARFLEHGLLEPIDISLSFDDGRRIELEGLYTISLDRLHALADGPALALFRQGDLQLAYAQSGSLGHIRALARRRNDRLVGEPA